MIECREESDTQANRSSVNERQQRRYSHVERIMSQSEGYRQYDEEEQTLEQRNRALWHMVVSTRATVERHNSQHLIGQSRIDIQLSYTKDYHPSIQSFHRYRTRLHLYLLDRRAGWCDGGGENDGERARARERGREKTPQQFNLHIDNGS